MSINPADFKQGDKLFVRCNPRPEYEGRGLKPEAQALSGRVFWVKVHWLMEDSDPYPGELYLTDVDTGVENGLSSAGLFWIASGDCEMVP